MAKGINAPNIFANLKVGNLNLKFGKTIMTLNIKYKKFDTDRKELFYVILLCFVVVILRSLTGMSISFARGG